MCVYENTRFSRPSQLNYEGFLDVVPTLAQYGAHLPDKMRRFFLPSVFLRFVQDEFGTISARALYHFIIRKGVSERGGFASFFFFCLSSSIFSLGPVLCLFFLCLDCCWFLIEVCFRLGFWRGSFFVCVSMCVRVCVNAFAGIPVGLVQHRLTLSLFDLDNTGYLTAQVGILSCL